MLHRLVKLVETAVLTIGRDGIVAKGLGVVALTLVMLMWIFHGP